MKVKPTKKAVKRADLSKVLGELAHLNRLPRSDFFKAGVREPISIGAFTSLAAQLSYVVAAGENADPCRTATMTLFTMLPNARVGVVDYLARGFINIGETRQKAMKAQLESWPESLATAVGELLEDSETRESLEARCAYEGYRLASAYFDAVYQRNGFATKSAWISSARSIVKTETGKAILAAIQTGAFEDWWQDLMP